MKCCILGKWAASCQNQQWLCAQWRLRSAWASAQSDQSSLCTQRVAKDPRFLHADSKDSDQTGRMPRLIWVFAGCTCYFVGFVMRLLNLWLQTSQDFVSGSYALLCKHIWAVTWQNLQSDCAPSEDSDQPGHLWVWSESSLSIWRKFGTLAIHWAHSEDSEAHLFGFT